MIHVVRATRVIDIRSLNSIFEIGVRDCCEYIPRIGKSLNVIIDRIGVSILWVRVARSRSRLEMEKITVNIY